MFAAPTKTAYSATTAEGQCISRAQSKQSQSPCMSARSMCGMWATAIAAASILLIQTGVSASVSLFVLLIALNGIFIVGLAGFLVLLGLSGLLSLSGLTGQMVRLVGLFTRLFPGTKTGD